MADDDRIAVGVIRKPHGVRGEASVELWTDSFERFAELREVTLVSPDERQTMKATIEAQRAHADRILIKFAEVGSPEDLVRYRDWTIEIPATEARALEEDEYFLHDLIGLELFDAAGKKLGVVSDTYEGGGGILLDVKRADGTTYAVPFAADICTEIDIAGKKMVANLPEGLDEI